MKRSLFLVLLIAGAISFLVGCASKLHGGGQNVVINTDHEDNQVFVDDSLVGTGKIVETKFVRNRKAKEIRIDRIGQESKTYATFEPTDEIYSTAGKEVVKLEDQKNIYINSAEVDIKAGDFVYHLIDHKHPSKVDKNPFSSKESLNSEGIQIQAILNDILRKRGYIDTAKTFLKKKTNSLYADAKITKWVCSEFYKTFWDASSSYFAYGEVEIEWTLRDVYKRILYEEVIVSTSDQFRCTDFRRRYGPYGKVFEDAVEKSLVEFIQLSEIEGYLRVEDEEQFSSAYAISNNAKIASKLSESIKASVTVIPNEDTHGSGFFINEDHIITNFHVVAGNDSVEITDNEGNKVVGEIIRSSEQHDLAVIKVQNYNSEFALSLQTARNEELGEEIFAIGTPSSIEFTQTLSKGIVSGRRKTDDVDYIQTDVSINPGNSGGPLVDKKGTLIGVVSAKLFGNDIEGMGFGIPAKKIVEFLRLELY